MAWLLHQDATPFAVVKFDVEPPCRELIPPVEYFRQSGIMHAYGRLARSAIDIEDRFWPRRAQLKTRRKSMPNLVGFCSFWGVSQAFRDCVDELEPGRHEFRPVEVLHKDGTQFDESYYAINIRELVINAVDWEKTDIPSKEFGVERRLVGLLRGKRIVMRQSAIEGLHLWISKDVVGGEIAVSDELYRKLADRKLLKGVLPFQVVEV